MIDHTLGPRVKVAREAVGATRQDARTYLLATKRFFRVISETTLARVENGNYRNWEEKWSKQLELLLARFTRNNLEARGD